MTVVMAPSFKRKALDGILQIGMPLLIGQGKTSLAAARRERARQ
jgi:hypothetical protein